MKNILPITFLLFIFLMISCKKEPPADSIPDPVDQPYNICYKDWQPDSTIHAGDTLGIDLGCSNAHYKLLLIAKTTAYEGSTPSGGPYYREITEVVPLDKNIKLSCGSYQSGQYMNLVKNEIIDHNLRWEPKMTLRGVVPRFGTVGYWTDNYKNEGYVGIELTTSNGVKYGWLKLNIPKEWVYDLTIEAQAMNDNVNQPIRAGQTQ